MLPMGTGKGAKCSLWEDLARYSLVLGLTLHRKVVLNHLKRLGKEERSVFRVQRGVPCSASDVIHAGQVEGRV